MFQLCFEMPEVALRGKYLRRPHRERERERKKNGGLYDGPLQWLARGSDALYALDPAKARGRRRSDRCPGRMGGPGPCPGPGGNTSRSASRKGKKTVACRAVSADNWHGVLVGGECWTRQRRELTGERWPGHPFTSRGGGIHCQVGNCQPGFGFCPHVH